jgi:hypothetical protein
VVEPEPDATEGGTFPDAAAIPQIVIESSHIEDGKRGSCRVQAFEGHPQDQRFGCAANDRSIRLYWPTDAAGSSTHQPQKLATVEVREHWLLGTKAYRARCTKEL